MVGVDLYANDAAGLQRSLAQLGARNVKTHGPLVSAQVPVGALGQLAALPTLRFAMPALAKVRVASQGDVVSQGDVSLGSNTVRTTTGLDGSGVTVGVMSDSYQCNPPPFVPGAPTTTAAQDEASQDVPPGVEVLDNGACPGSDEGRGMVQLVHDVAPGAAQKFHTAFNSLVDFADGILELQEAGSDVIVDDVIYFAENMFSDGIVAQAADQAVARGAAYFSSAGNQARQSYESAYRETTGVDQRRRQQQRQRRAVRPARARFRSRRRHRYAAEGPRDAGRQRTGPHRFQPAVGPAVPVLDRVRAGHGPEWRRAARRDRRSRHAHLYGQGRAGAALSARRVDRHHLSARGDAQRRRRRGGSHAAVRRRTEVEDQRLLHPHRARGRSRRRRTSST